MMVSPRTAGWIVGGCLVLWFLGSILTRAMRASGGFADYSVDRDR